MLSHELIADIANISLSLTFIVGLVIGLAQIKAATRDRKDRLTLETLRVFQSREFAELMHFVFSDSFPQNRQELNALSSEQRIMFTQYAQIMESLGILVAGRFIDIDLVDKTIGSMVMMTWKKYEQVYGTMRERDPYIAEYFQWLSERMDERMAKNPREPFYKTPDLE